MYMFGRDRRDDQYCLCLSRALRPLHNTYEELVLLRRDVSHLVCRVCKGFAHDGICKHVLAVTHIIERKKPKHEQNQRLNLKRLNKVAASNT